MASHGDITDLVYNHPTLGTGTFFAIANQSNTFDLGGFRTADDAGMIDSSGSPIYQINQVRGSFEIMVSNSGDTLNILSELAASPDPATWTVSLINGRVYKGLGKPVGDINAESNSGNITLKISGGRFVKIIG